MRKFLLISYAFPPSTVVGALRPYRLCRYLPDHAWVPEVVTVEPTKSNSPGLNVDLKINRDIRVHRTKRFDPLGYYKAMKRDGNSKQGQQKENREQLVVSDSGELSYSKEAPEGWMQRIKNGIMGTITTPDRQVFWGPMLLKQGAQVLHREGRKLRFILTTSPPHSSQVFGCLLAKAFGKPHVMDLRDPWTDVYRGYQSKTRRTIEKKLENWVVNNSACIISSTEAYTKILRKRYANLSASRFQTVTNSFEEEEFEKIEAEPSEKFIIAYLGIFYPRRDPYCFFKALSIWLENHPEHIASVEFRLIGECDTTTSAMIKRYKLEPVVHVTGRLPHDEAIRMTKGSDLLILAMGTGRDTPKGWVPSKLYEYLACKKPILANIPEGQASKIIKKTQSGFLVHSDDVHAIMKILDQEYHKKKNSTPGKYFPPFSPKWDEVLKFGNRFCIQRFVELFNSLII